LSEKINHRPASGWTIYVVAQNRPDKAMPTANKVPGPTFYFDESTANAGLRRLNPNGDEPYYGVYEGELTLHKRLNVASDPLPAPRRSVALSDDSLLAMLKVLERNLSDYQAPTDALVEGIREIYLEALTRTLDVTFYWQCRNAIDTSSWPLPATETSPNDSGLFLKSPRIVDDAVSDLAVDFDDDEPGKSGRASG